MEQISNRTKKGILLGFCIVGVLLLVVITSTSGAWAVTNEQLISGTLTVDESTAYMEMLGEVGKTCRTYAMAQDEEHIQICFGIMTAFRDKMVELVAEHPEIDDLPGVRMP
jgi:hypothetical protein